MRSDGHQNNVSGESGRIDFTASAKSSFAELTNALATVLKTYNIATGNRNTVKFTAQASLPCDVT